MEHFAELGYLGLFLAAFLAATLLPLSSEAVLGALLLNGWSPLWLVLIATLGNTLGSLVNYGLGYWASQVAVRKWFALSEAEFERAEQRFRKYGILSLCFAWLPVVGDPLTAMAGVLRVPLAWFVPLVALGKGLRYLVVSYLTLQLT